MREMYITNKEISSQIVSPNGITDVFLGIANLHGQYVSTMHRRPSLRAMFSEAAARECRGILLPLHNRWRRGDSAFKSPKGSIKLSDFIVSIGKKRNIRFGGCSLCSGDHTSSIMTLITVV